MSTIYGKLHSCTRVTASVVLGPEDLEGLVQAQVRGELEHTLTVKFCGENVTLHLVTPEKSDLKTLDFTAEGVRATGRGTFSLP